MYPLNDPTSVIWLTRVSQNWFQNRRAKSKQDAKKQAGAFNLLQATQQPSFAMNSMNSMNPDNISPTYCAPDFFSLRDSAIMDGPMQNGLGISQAEHQSQMLSNDYTMGGHMSMPMQQQGSQHQHPIREDSLNVNDQHRRTMTQAQFDAYSSGSYAPSSAVDSAHSLSATITNPAEIYDEYFPDLCDFNFDHAAEPEVTSAPMQHSQSADSYLSTSSAADSVAFTATSNDEHARHASSTSTDSSTPSVSITPAKQESDPFDFDLPVSSSGPAQPASATQWTPGTSVPVDYAALQQEFQDIRNGRNQSVGALSSDYMEQPLAYPSDDSFQRDSSTAQMTRSMKNFSMVGPRAATPSSTIAARRQRPRPTPLGTGAMRSTSYGASMPTSPGPSSASGQTLRRIKSSQTMNGIANGRIQKNVGTAQRSPSGFTFADAANANRYARRMPSFSSANMPQSAGLAPPTPLSPSAISGSGYANMQGQSMGECDGDMMSVVPSSTFSPPNTPLYAQNFSRTRLGSLSVAENTPPQSAPATQQCFSMNSHMQGSIPPVPTLQSQGFVSMMPNEYPQMPNVYSSQQQNMNGQYMSMPMSYIMTNTGEVHVGYPVMPPFAQNQMQQQSTPPHQQHPFVPSSSASPGLLLSPQSKQATPAADFFVHEYSPPQDVKHSATPRKAVDNGPKNYTFSNHGPEFFEKSSKHKESSSPASSVGGSSTG